MNALVKLHPESSNVTHAKLAAANTKVMRVFLSATETNDAAACNLLRLNSDVSGYLSEKMLSQIGIITSGSNMSIFKCVFKDAAQLKSLADSKFNADDLQSLFDTRLDVATNPCRPMNVSAIISANEFVLDSWVSCATSGDPLASSLLGCSQDLLMELTITSRTALLNAMYKYGLPLFVNRFDDLQVWQGICGSGFATPLVQRAFLQAA